MDFNFMEEEHCLLQESVRRFANNEIAPLAEEIDRTDEIPEDLFAKLGRLGIMGITIPEEFGGAGSDLLAGLIVTEELGRVSPAVSLSYGAHTNLCVHNLYRNGTAEQRRKYLPPLCSGEHIGALALTEPGAGSDAVSIKTRAVKKGNEYILNGSKTFITNGPIADTLIVYAKTDSQGGAKGISAFIVEKDFPGFKVARKLEKMGMRGSPTAELFFDDCRVPAENLLGKEHLGIDVMMSGLDLERAFLTGLPLGMAQAAFELSVKYARERVQFGRPIASFQLIQAKLADMYTQIEAARLYCYQVARLAQSAEHGGKGTTIHKRAASALLFAAEMCERVTYEAVQIHGGYGYMLEYPVQRLMRDARLMTIGAGTSEIRRLVVAREILSQD
jgi:isovaleryl-CoA dehydrogenase